MTEILERFDKEFPIIGGWPAELQTKDELPEETDIRDFVKSFLSREIQAAELRGAKKVLAAICSAINDEIDVFPPADSEHIVDAAAEAIAAIKARKV